jgi:dienelactone hydrolase
MRCMNRVKTWMLLLNFGALVVRACGVDLQAPPARQPTNAPQLSRLLVDSHGQPISSKRNWLEQRARLKERWQSFLGEFPANKAPLKTEMLATEDLGVFTRQLVKYQVEDGLFTDGYLLVPRTSSGTDREPLRARTARVPVRGKFAAVVVFHPTTPLQAKGVAGLAPEYPEEKWQGVQLVRRGYVVWCPRNYIETAGTNWAGNAARVVIQHPNWTGMTRMVWDAIRAADFLESLPNVDRKRIGCLGHSLGGKEVPYAMAFDERYRAGVASEGGIGLNFSNWSAPWYFGAKLKQPAFDLENHEVLALIAPRAFLLLAGDSADDDRSWTFIKAAKPVYELLGVSQNIGWLNHHQGHRYSPEARAVAEEFLDQHLRR